MIPKASIKRDGATVLTLVSSFELRGSSLAQDLQYKGTTSSGGTSGDLNLMADQSLDLQQAIIAALRGSSELAALVGDRIYDRPPTGAATPYVSLGPEDWTTFEASCLDAYTGALQIDAWSTSVGKPEVKRIANAVQEALLQAPLSIDPGALVLLTHRVTRYFREGDGITEHAAMDFRAFTESP